MSFSNYDVTGVTAQQHQQELVKHAVEFRLVRQAKQRHPSKWRRLTHARGHPDAA